MRAWLLREVNVPLREHVTLLRRRHVRGRGPLIVRLPRLRPLVRAQEHEDDAPILDGLDAPGDVGPSIAETLDVIEDGDGSGGAQKKVTLRERRSKVRLNRGRAYVGRRSYMEGLYK